MTFITVAKKTLHILDSVIFYFLDMRHPDFLKGSQSSIISDFAFCQIPFVFPIAFVRDCFKNTLFECRPMILYDFIWMNFDQQICLLNRNSFSVGWSTSQILLNSFSSTGQISSCINKSFKSSLYTNKPTRICTVLIVFCYFEIWLHC